MEGNLELPADSVHRKVSFYNQQKLAFWPKKEQRPHAAAPRGAFMYI